ncbi:MAG: YggS family pyridoxal phosphate-dependent enzyme [Luteolibacter sp.]
MSNSIVQRLSEVRQRIVAACQRAGRDPDTVRLIAVSKTFPAEAVLQAIVAGHYRFGESRLQEAQAKLEQLPADLSWHFIGRVQRNKIRKILPLFGTIHGIDSLKLAEHTDRVAAEMGLRPKVFLQVNIGREGSKGGFDPEQIGCEVDALIALNQIDIQGLMCIPPIEPDEQAARKWFIRLRELQQVLTPHFGAGFSQLSMGMSGDYEVAIEEGATVVRVGSAIFGGRS